MVEPWPSKPAMRVRSPSLAQKDGLQVRYLESVFLIDQHSQFEISSGAHEIVFRFVQSFAMAKLKTKLFAIEANKLRTRP